MSCDENIQWEEGLTFMDVFNYRGGTMEWGGGGWCELKETNEAKFSCRKRKKINDILVNFSFFMCLCVEMLSVKVFFFFDLAENDKRTQGV